MAIAVPLAGAAPKPTVSMAAGLVTVTAKGNVDDSWVLAGNAASMTVTATSDITAGTGCTQTSTMVVTCAAATVVSADSGSGNDVVNAAALDLPVTASLGAGNDSFTGGTKADTVDGGAGDDAIAGGGGVDTVTYSTATADVRVDFDGNADDGVSSTERDNVAADVENAIGGAGNDFLVGNSKANRLTGGAGNDTLTGYGAVDQLYGGDGNDVAVGGAGADRLYGEAGNDRLVGGKGKDVAAGGAGNDNLNSRDHKKGDKSKGGAGADKCLANRGDKLTSCETKRYAG
jgi:Ca2+-binding RTX toxin-like protein